MEENGAVSSPSVQVLDGSEQQFGLSRLLMKPGLLLTTTSTLRPGWPWAALDELNISDRFAVLSVSLVISAD